MLEAFSQVSQQNQAQLQHKIRLLNLIHFHISLSDKTLSFYELEEDTQQSAVAGKGLKCAKTKKNVSKQG